MKNVIRDRNTGNKPAAQPRTCKAFPAIDAFLKEAEVKAVAPASPELGGISSEPTQQAPTYEQMLRAALALDEDVNEPLEDLSSDLWVLKAALSSSQDRIGPEDVDRFIFGMIRRLDVVRKVLQADDDASRQAVRS